ncbi:Peptidase S1 domain-containing protein [Caenorhabditis elegans]|uniref:Peptidase S1 domain-containing protein n=1 Tax=Caenorhabditis elegans TaxID=6239 RepID=O76652_CAEEL|nr:Peptidase S1 domain-containing protein [Caenorhabditis elegans]CCD65088.1 Peptidase S1 domain-containing protein [Caenorhabditis elegans]|eukprot:NP_504914.3 Uncharacterized protein CELE_F25E5.4 [Caenorhabditis elegans]
MKVSLLVLTILFTAVCAGKLDEKHNEILQLKCGIKGSQREFINGDTARPGDHPWAVSVYVKANTTSKNGVFLGPGTLISARHVLTFNSIKVVDGKRRILGQEEVNGACNGNHFELSQDEMYHFDYDFEHFKNFDSKRDFKNTIASVYIINGCQSSPPPATLLMFELKESALHNKKGYPVCISNSPKHFDASDFEVFGLNQQGRLVSGAFAPTNCTATAPFSCAHAVKQNQGLCSGDFGGSAVSRIDNRFTMLGFFAQGNKNCKAKPETLEAFKFLNIGYYREEICEVTGICTPSPPSPEESTTLSPSELIPGESTDTPPSSKTDVPEGTTEQEFFTEGPASTDHSISTTDQRERLKTSFSLKNQHLQLFHLLQTCPREPLSKNFSQKNQSLHLTQLLLPSPREQLQKKSSRKIPCPHMSLPEQLK